MRRFAVTTLLGLMAWSASTLPATAQDFSMKGQYAMVRDWLTKAAAQMPEADYTFKPTPDVRSYGQLIGHVANSVGMICTVPAGGKSPLTGNAEQLATKAALTKALSDAFAACDQAWAAMTPAWNTETAPLFGGPPQTKTAILAFNTAHAFEHYGNVVTYLRLKGLVPPSSQK